MCLHQARRKIKAVLNDFNAYLVLQNDQVGNDNTCNVIYISDKGNEDPEN